MKELCSRNENKPSSGPSALPPKLPVKGKGPEVIDLTGADGGDISKPGPIPKSTEPISFQDAKDPAIPDYSVFAHGEAMATEKELLECLRSEELKDLAKTLKMRLSKNKVRLWAFCFECGTSLRGLISLYKIAHRTHGSAARIPS